jgi:hypothetical protein
MGDVIFPKCGHVWHLLLCLLNSVQVVGPVDHVSIRGFQLS